MIKCSLLLQCEENYGVFVRQSQIQLLDSEDNPMETSMTTSSEEPKSTVSNRRLSRYADYIFYDSIYLVVSSRQNCEEWYNLDKFA